jgi:hypothetical protein
VATMNDKLTFSEPGADEPAPESKFREGLLFGPRTQSRGALTSLTQTPEDRVPLGSNQSSRRDSIFVT